MQRAGCAETQSPHDDTTALAISALRAATTAAIRGAMMSRERGPRRPRILPILVGLDPDATEPRAHGEGRGAPPCRVRRAAGGPGGRGACIGEGRPSRPALRPRHRTPARRGRRAAARGGNAASRHGRGNGYRGRGRERCACGGGGACWSRRSRKAGSRGSQGCPSSRSAAGHSSPRVGTISLRPVFVRST